VGRPFKFKNKWMMYERCSDITKVGLHTGQHILEKVHAAMDNF
jgi:hypothetical protein